ncbi:MAG: hypothetical protein U1E72_06825 [Burkholderiaceae bacterium]
MPRSRCSCVYYGLFGTVSTLALAFNPALLVAVLSMLQATLTLPGIAAIALALGMAIDAVLINERVREELRGGAGPQMAIRNGYDRAFGTILDSNITTLIAGVALLAFGSGPVRGASPWCTTWASASMFSAVMFSRSWSACGTAGASGGSPVDRPESGGPMAPRRPRASPGLSRAARS